jgi:Na+/glutamate symporter
MGTESIITGILAEAVTSQPVQASQIDWSSILMPLGPALLVAIGAIVGIWLTNKHNLKRMHTEAAIQDKRRKRELKIERTEELVQLVSEMNLALSVSLAGLQTSLRATSLLTKCLNMQTRSRIPQSSP